MLDKQKAIVVIYWEMNSDDGTPYRYRGNKLVGINVINYSKKSKGIEFVIFKRVKFSYISHRV